VVGEEVEELDIKPKVFHLHISDLFSLNSLCINENLMSHFLFIVMFIFILVFRGKRLKQIRAR
jgi:hypothetical protein